MLVESGLERKYWCYAIKYAAKVSNVTSTSALNGLIPLSYFMDALRRLLCTTPLVASAFAKYIRSLHPSLSVVCSLVSDNHEAFIVLRLHDSRVMISRDVNFIDDSFPLTSKTVPCLTMMMTVMKLVFILVSKELEKEEEDDEDDDNLTIQITPGLPS